MTFGDSLGYIAAVLVFLTFSMKTMVRLRIIGIVSNIFFISYGYLDHATPVLILHSVLLPMNIFRLRQIIVLVRKVEAATKGDPDMQWLKSIGSSRAVKTGETLFRKGDAADAMLFVVTGRFHVEGLGIDIEPGHMIGEIALLAPDRARTQTVTCTANGEVLEVSYEQAKLLYFQNPKFGFYLLQLAGRRLLENNERLEKQLAASHSAETVTHVS